MVGGRQEKGEQIDSEQKVVASSEMRTGQWNAMGGQKAANFGKQFSRQAVVVSKTKPENVHARRPYKKLDLGATVVAAVAAAAAAAVEAACWLTDSHTDLLVLESVNCFRFQRQLPGEPWTDEGVD